MWKEHSLLGLLVQLLSVPIQHLAGIMVRGEVADIMDLGPSSLRESRQWSFPAQERLEWPDSKGWHCSGWDCLLGRSP